MNGFVKMMFVSGAAACSLLVVAEDARACSLAEAFPIENGLSPADEVSVHPSVQILVGAVGGGLPEVNFLDCDDVCTPSDSLEPVFVESLPRAGFAESLSVYALPDGSPDGEYIFEAGEYEPDIYGVRINVDSDVTPPSSVGDFTFGWDHVEFDGTVQDSCLDHVRSGVRLRLQPDLSGRTAWYSVRTVGEGEGAQFAVVPGFQDADWNEPPRTDLRSSIQRITLLDVDVKCVEVTPVDHYGNRGQALDSCTPDACGFESAYSTDPDVFESYLGDCEDDDFDDEDDFDDLDDEEEIDGEEDSDDDVDGEEQEDRPDGWTFDEEGSMQDASDSGCGCSTSGRSLPGSVLLLLVAAALARRRRSVVTG